MRYRNQGVVYRLGAMAMVVWLGVGCASLQSPGGQLEPIVLVVMDPLAKELACACVKGYGQRDYRKLAVRLQAALKHRISIEFSDDLAETLAIVGRGREVIVIGEPSLVIHGAKPAELKIRPVCKLTGLDGGTTVTGLFVARTDDPAKEIKDIGGRKVFFGLVDTDEKHAAALAALRDAKLDPPAEPLSRPSGNDAALDVVDSSASPPPVAVIPSYALPLLEGCGSIKKGDLKVIGETAAVPFITVFLSDSIASDKQADILNSLLGMKDDATLLKVMESRDGFKPVNAQKPGGPQASDAPDWPDWRGPGRDGRVPRLPARLPQTTKLIWKKAAMTDGLAGLSVSNGRLILAERDFGDEYDVYRCLNADNGELLWRVEFPARGRLDYGQSPRATPVIHQGRAYLLGAFGDLRCVDMTDGTLVWERNLPREFRAELPTWGMCSTPLVVDDLLIVNPGGSNASLAALDCVTGRTRWTTRGSSAAYSAFICGQFGGRRQIVGYDQDSLGGWDVKTGRRLWKLMPPIEGDFNVPTPIATDGSLIVSTENNGTRLYHFDGYGRIIPEPVGHFAALAPDSATPVMTGGRLFGAHLGLHCLDVRSGLRPVWHLEVIAGRLCDVDR